MDLSKKYKYRICLQLIAIFFLGALLYANTLKAPFHLDDSVCIVDNYTIKNINDLETIWKGILPHPSRVIGFYTFALNYHFHGLDVTGYHIVNILIHLVAAVTVFGVIFLLLKILYKDLKKESLIPFFTALIFVSHPVQTQAVTYITQRFESLASLFYLLSVFFYLLSKNTKLYYEKFFCFFATILFGVMGMFTKEIVITLPFMILFIEFFLSRHEREQDEQKKKQKKKFFVVLASLVVIFSLVIPLVFSFQIKQMLLTPRISSSHQGDILSLDKYLFTQIRVFATFVRLYFFPMGQNLDYDFVMSHHFFEGKLLLSAVFLVAIIFFAFKCWKRYPIVSFGIFWFFIVLSANLVPRRHVIFEHKLYLPSVGLALCIAFCLENFIESKKKAVAIILIITGLLGFLTLKRNQVWSSEILLWSDIVKKSPHKARPHTSLGIAYSEKGRYADAIKEYKIAVSLNSQNGNIYYNRGCAFEQLGKLDLALQDYSRSIELDPKFVKSYHARAMIFRKVGKYQEALKDYSNAIQIDDHYAIGYGNRANLYNLLGQHFLALEDYKKAIEIDSRYWMAYFNRGLTYMILDKDELAIRDFEKTLLLNPGFAPAQEFLEKIYCQKGDPQKCPSHSSL